jgi:molybdopterin/thiamine biosynthesis adenylyltransferase
MFDTRLTSANALDVLRGFDVVLDGSDNFPTRYLVNDACVLLGLPNIYGAVLRFEGRSRCSTRGAACTAVCTASRHRRSSSPRAPRGGAGRLAGNHR